MSTMKPRIEHWGSILSRRIRSLNANSAIGALAVALAAYVIVYPFFVVRYPPITDLPFHAAEASILRHYLDPDWHFREQFSLHPFDAPYISMYLVGVFFELFLPTVIAIKAMVIVMLGLLPAGLAVMFHGMKKSPLWGLLGLEVVWCTITHWGFLNFMGAIGLFAMVIGFTLLALDRPTVPRVVGLTLSVLAVFFTHIYRFPFAIAVVVGTTIVMYPATRRVRPVIAPVLIALAVFGAWRLVRRPLLASDVGPLAWHWERTQEMMSYLFGSFYGSSEQQLGSQLLYATLALFVITVVVFLVQGRHRKRSRRSLYWGAGVTLLPILVSIVYFGCYYVLPMTIGIWWFVYPREVVTALFMAFGAFPDMPRQWWLRLPLVAALAFFVGRAAYFYADQWYAFETATTDFRAVAEEVPRGSKLMYLVFDHSGSTRTSTPFIHLPAWIQAEKGGWLSFHFVGWDLHPIRYRENDPNVPPPRVPRWEWTPELFNLDRDGPWFDTFLVRHRSPPHHLFAADPSIKLVRNVGTWWLYRRQ
jgi:hypothetical protein